MTKFIVIGDPHIKVSNIEEVNLLIDKLLQLVKDKQPDFIVILGDVLHDHERLHTTALNKAYEFIDKLRSLVPTYVLVGNHDMTSNQNFLNQNHWLNGMKEWDNVTIVDVVHTLKHDNKLFFFCPYVPNGRFIEALETYEKKSWKKATCIFAHQEFYGCAMNTITSVEGDKWDLKFPHVISGHIHSKQRIQKNIYYTGSAMQHAFGESTKNIIAVVEFKDNEKDYELEEIDLKLPRKKIIHSSIEDINSLVIPEESKDKIKITISGGYNDFKTFKKTKKYKDLIKSGTKVVFKPKKIKVKKPGKNKGENDEENENENEGENDTENDFKTILLNMITKENNSYLTQTYNYIFNEKR